MQYSPSTGGFYDPSIHGDGIPADAIEVSDDDYWALMAAPADGKIIAASETGYPVAVDPPPLPPEQLLAANTALRNRLLAEAAERMAPLQDAVDLGMATEEEQARLLQWKQYRIALSRLDLTLAPVPWPGTPGE
ncbi:tail fiber assembly protein [Cupriavidus gilardii]|uniref:tail fiber assembly protein n=1 Tax=Cupriavidus gilardii TaxID=82541 RepID=UPI0021C135B4|nr:tail fiber assembly protein [Cupriavidus gilardii]MCT9014628.1 tail fiber assembly protein [Cupriavidus gilardii]MCT9054348.1 tail fiber assembly protein [Cupriavidus gilardii]